MICGFSVCVRSKFESESVSGASKLFAKRVASAEDDHRIHCTYLLVHLKSHFYSIFYNFILNCTNTGVGELYYY